MRQMRWFFVAIFVCAFLIVPVLSVSQTSQSLWTKEIHADTIGNVTFQVNMKIKMMEGTFDPGNGDFVRVAGSFNNWGSSTDTLWDIDGDSIYSGTVNAIPVGDITYKFLKTLRGGIDWEGSLPDNRLFPVAGGDETVPVVYFDDDSVYTPPSTTVNVTFQVNMKIKMLEDAFQPGNGDIVRVAGSFNGWGSSTDTLTDVDGDSIYSKTLPISQNTSIQYKFLKTLRGGLDWENVANRPYDVMTSDVVIPAPYFDDDSVYTAPIAANVTFSVNMRVKILEQTFQPDNGDIVRVAGSFNNWGSSTDTLTDGDNDSVYTKTVALLENQAIQYKFLKTPRGGSDWENGNNHEYTVPTGGGSTDPNHFFDDDSIVNTPINANIIFRVDMNVYQQLGWFDPSGDTIQVRGPFNSWGGTVMSENPFVPGQYRVTIPYSGTAYDQLQYKVFLQLNQATGESRFPGFTADNDKVQYEHPAERGDGNRVYDVGTGGNIATPSFYFSSINPGGIIPAGDTVTVTLRANMGPATRYTIPFDLANDTLRVVWQDGLWNGTQRVSQGAFDNIDFAPVAPGDTIYQATFDVVGPTHYNLQYTYRYVQPGGATVDNGGGLGGQNPYVSRFIVPTSPGVFPRTYTAPIDAWQKNGPLPGESAPYNITTGVFEGKVAGVPSTFKLNQNYPNPFNPSTRIDYSIPEHSTVSLKVFNMLGQQVANLVNEEKDPGNYFVHFEGTNLSSGVYYYRIEAGKYVDVRKMMLIK